MFTKHKIELEIIIIKTRGCKKNFVVPLNTDDVRVIAWHFSKHKMATIFSIELFVTCCESNYIHGKRIFLLLFLDCLCNKDNEKRKVDDSRGHKWIDETQ